MNKMGKQARVNSCKHALVNSAKHSYIRVNLERKWVNIVRNM